MSTPPPGGWQPGPPPNQGQPYGHSGYNPQQPPPGWHQGNWPHQPGPPPPQKGNSLKWLLIGVAVLLVIGISVGATLLVTRDGGGGTTTSTSAALSDIASANDTGPVAIITDEPTCETFIGINNSLASIEANGWTDRRNSLGTASEWTQEEQSQVRSVASAIRKAADQMVPLARRTTHRVVRELYEQSLLYGRLYADSVDTYTPKDNFLADVFVNGSSAIAGMCTTATNGSAGRSIGIEAAPEPSSNPTVGNSNPERFVSGSNAYCSVWVEREKKFVADTNTWASLDASIPSTQWSPEQRAEQLAAVPIFQAYADDMVAEGKRSGNQTFEDLAFTSALYLRAYASTTDDYTNADSWLYYTAFRLSNTVTTACQAAG